MIKNGRKSVQMLKNSLGPLFCHEYLQNDHLKTIVGVFLNKNNDFIQFRAEIHQKCGNEKI